MDEKTATPKKPMTKTEMTAALAESTGLTKQQVVSLLDELATLERFTKPSIALWGDCVN